MRKKLNQVNFLLIGIFVFIHFVAEAAPRKRFSVDDEPGYVTKALAEDKQNNNQTPSNDTKNGNAKQKNAPAKSINKPATSANLKKNKIKNTKAPSNEKQWLPEMGQNADTLKEKEQKIEVRKYEEQLVQDLSDLNYNTFIPPRELYEIPANDYQNNHLPKIYFQSDYLKMIIHSINKNDFNSLRVILDNYEFINEPHINGDTILTYAIQHNHLNSARILLAKGAEVDAMNNRNRTALHYAAALGNVDSVRLLLSMGADPHAVDDLNMKPIDYAMVAQQPQVELLLNEYLTSIE